MKKSTTIKIFTIALLLSVMITGTAFADDYYDWERGVIKVSGAAGVPAKTRSPKAAFFKARMRQAARLEASRTFAELMNGVTVDSFDDRTADINVVHTKTVGMLGRIKMQKVSEKFDEYGNCFADFEVPMFGGNDSVAAGLYSANTKPSPFPAPHSAVSAVGNYTGVIIDCRGLNFSPTFFPVINDGSRTIFSCSNLDYATLVKMGSVGYAKDGGNTARAGKNPLVVRAVSYDKDKKCLLLADADADRMLAENARTKFLNHGATVILLNK